MSFLELLWVIPLAPLAGAALMLVLGRLLDPQASSQVAVAPGLAADLPQPHGHGSGHHRHGAARSLISLLCPGTVLVSFVLSLGAVFELSSLPGRTYELVQFTWIAGLPFLTQSGAPARFSADWGFLLDPLSAVMILVVTGVGFLIHVYSVGYMGHEGGYYRFFGYLNLFVFFMLMLVLANNYALMFVGWEGVGLCSYLLIGFYFHRKSAADAGKKAFVMNRVGDAGFILGMLLMFSVFGSVRFREVHEALASGRFAAETGSLGVLTAIALLLFLGATGKSAQFPLYTWLPDAMEGPTPVSALIHAATMVTAGVYMVARSHLLYRLAPEASMAVAVIGAFTAILAASIALVQNDIKRVLAYSTVSQLGYMFMACGVGAYWVAIFHLYTHAFFKALLFLGSGSVIHALGGEQDMRRMGGLKEKIPVTYWTMVVGALAISGIPGFAGFFSKDEILWQIYSSPHGSKAIYVVATLTAGMTAFYMWRLIFMTFHGKPRMDADTLARVHESPRVMTVPLVALAAGSTLAGWIGVPKVWSFLPESFRAFEHWLAPALSTQASHGTEHAHGAATEWLLMGLSLAIALAGIAIARHLYVVRPERVAALRQAAGPLYTALANKWYVDELYDAVFVNGLGKGVGSAMARFDSRIVDGGVNGAGWMTRLASTLSIWWDTWIVDGAVRLMSFVVKAASFPVRVLHTGSVQAYALVIVLGAAALFTWYLVR
ncbi:MAG: NADH-quinone oxidoreductase subunit L [Bryobacterales bacterium]|nr:NADH-quinone oxidoreductase subunit L [Bryobacteraceae bacterium]MDW8130928.1 NADH-quinone oxidoreductase subunit L [Bryobacterales bacterium]